MKRNLTPVVLIVFVILTSTNLVYSQQSAKLPDYKTRIKILHEVINNKFRDKPANLYYETNDSSKATRQHSYLWPLCAFIQAANEMEVLEPKAQYMLPVVAAIDQYHNDAPPTNGYQATVFTGKYDDRYYDDDEWIAIAYMDAFNRNHGKKYLEEAESISRFLLSGLDTVAGGGFYWRERDKASKNTCSNGPGILVMLQLYNATHKASYLKTAVEVYEWTNKNLQSPSGVYYDNIRIPSKKLGPAMITYNTGTMLESNVLLYQITKDKKYLTEAQRVAAAGREHFFKNGRLPNGNYWFNAVMLRGYQALYKVDKNKAWIDFYRADADAIWNTERDPATNQVGIKPEKRLIDQAAMIEIYARLEELAK
jgi:uncharacterized protein YyaL (SSP411 family)